MRSWGRSAIRSRRLWSALATHAFRLSSIRFIMERCHA